MSDVERRVSVVRQPIVVLPAGNVIWTTVVVANLVSMSFVKNELPQLSWAFICAKHATTLEESISSCAFYRPPTGYHAASGPSPNKNERI